MLCVMQSDMKMQDATHACECVYDMYHARRHEKKKQWNEYYVLSCYSRHPHPLLNNFKKILKMYK